MASPPRNKKAKAANSKQKRKGLLSRTWEGVKKASLEGLAQKIKDKFNWSHSPRKFQLEAIEAQLLRRDVLIHAGTGSGKTAVAAGPHAHESTKGMVTFMVSPLIALQEEQVETFRKEFQLRAIAVNSAYSGCSKEVMNEICEGKYQIVVISPEMMLSKRFVKNVLRNRELARRVLSVVIDEAHVVSHWGSGFRKKYGTLGILRALLPKRTPMVAMSATLPARVRRDVLEKLQFDLKDYLNLNVGNDRPNVSIVIRSIQNPMNAYSDLDFLIPEGDVSPNECKKTFIYADNITVGIDIEDHLYDRAPASWRDAGIIRPYSAAFSLEYRTNVMELFKAGIVRILICTDAAGMGCNIPDIDIVVQWKLPASVSSFVQRAGRAARGPDRTGLAVLLVEKPTYEADLSKLENAIKETKKKSVRQSSTYPKATKQYAIEHGLLRGGSSRTNDENILKKDVPIDWDSNDEGLYSLVQTGTCRRQFLTKIYGNDTPHPTVACCDICDPSLLNLTRPAPPIPLKRKAPIKSGIPNPTVKSALYKWRKEIWTRDFEDSQFGPSGILKNDTLELLASVGRILTLIDLESKLDGWMWFGKYGDSLLERMISLSIPPMIPKGKEKGPAKRAQSNEDGGTDGSVVGREKRARTAVQNSAHSQTPTPVVPRASLTSTLPSAVAVTPLRADSYYSYPIAQNPYRNFVTPINYHSPAPQQYATSYHSSPYYFPFPNTMPIPQNIPPMTPQPPSRPPSANQLQFQHYNPDSGPSSRR